MKGGCRERSVSTVWWGTRAGAQRKLPLEEKEKRSRWRWQSGFWGHGNQWRPLGLLNPTPVATGSQSRAVCEQLCSRSWWTDDDSAHPSPLNALQPFVVHLKPSACKTKKARQALWCCGQRDGEGNDFSSSGWDALKRGLRQNSLQTQGVRLCCVILCGGEAVTALCALLQWFLERTAGLCSWTPRQADSCMASADISALHCILRNTISSCQ